MDQNYQRLLYLAHFLGFNVKTPNDPKRIASLSFLLEYAQDQSVQYSTDECDVDILTKILKKINQHPKIGLSYDIYTNGNSIGVDKRVGAELWAQP